MNTWIWSRSDLIQLSRHNAPIVRRWACERLQTLYGRQSDEVLEELLRDGDREVLLEALRLDPLAVEAYASLGEFESDKGNPSCVGVKSDKPLVCAQLLLPPLSKRHPEFHR